MIKQTTVELNDGKHPCIIEYTSDHKIISAVADMGGWFMDLFAPRIDYGVVSSAIKQIEVML